MIWTYGDLDSTQNRGPVISRGVLGSISPTINSFFEKNIGFWDPFSGRILTEIPDLDDGSQVGFFSSGNGQKLASGPTALHFHAPFPPSSDFPFPDFLKNPRIFRIPAVPPAYLLPISCLSARDWVAIPALWAGDLWAGGLCSPGILVLSSAAHCIVSAS